MDFILNEAIKEREDDFKLVFSENSEEEYSEEEDEMFICDESDDEDGEQDASFYRSLNNKEEHVKFPNQTKNPEEVVQESDDEYFGEDDMPELFDPENRDEVEFNSFDNSSNKSQAFKESLVCFGNVDNHFFYAVVYGLMYCKNNEGNVFLENSEETLGNELFIEVKKIEKSTMLDHSIFGFFDPCKLINDVLCEYGFFLRFYERRNKFRYQLKRKLKEKNQMKRELSACIIQKFNGYELLRNHLNSTERKNFIPIDIVFEPTLNEKKKQLSVFLHQKFL